MTRKRNTMTPNEISRVQRYLQKTFGNAEITVAPPANPRAPVEVCLGGQFLGTLHRDDDEGEISYALHISILEEDLPAAGAVPSSTRG